MSELKMTKDMKEAVISTLTEIPNITAVCKLLGVSKSTVDEHRGKDKAFDALVRDAIEEGYDMLEYEAWRRAKEGVSEPLLYQGEVVGHVQKYSDTLLKFLLKGRRRKVFGDSQFIGADDTGKVTLTFNIGGKDD